MTSSLLPSVAVPQSGLSTELQSTGVIRKGVLARRHSCDVLERQTVNENTCNEAIVIER
ncbi:14088_t:CDS:2 [Entrophospora sp. SA101]|nr:17083_t:CDS:2 [Entrophospora sp. SA101]CAJ0839453.1 14088_t:CDS:2 [Entrophospora sp. SA101]